jgi:hypothetical protein
MVDGYREPCDAAAVGLDQLSDAVDAADLFGQGGIVQDVVGADEHLESIELSAARACEELTHRRLVLFTARHG